MPSQGATGLVEVDADHSDGNSFVQIGINPAAGCGLATLPFSDSFTRANSSTVGNCWLETESGAADATINTNRLQFNSTDFDHTYVELPFVEVSSGLLKWTYVFNWDKTGAESTYALWMQLGDTATWVSPSTSDNTGVAVNLKWAGTNDGMTADEGFGYVQGAAVTQVLVVSGGPSNDHTIEVIADLDLNTFTLKIDDVTQASDVAFDNNVNINGVRIYTDALVTTNFNNREFDDLTIELTSAPTCPGGSVCWDGGAGGGNPEWSNGLNWTGDAVPGSSALVVFNDLSSNPATFDVADQIGSLTIEAGYTGTITLAATMTNDGAFVMNGGNLTMGSTTVNQNDDWTYTAGVVNAGTSNVVFASTDLAVSSGAMTFYDVTLSLGGGNSLTVTGTMDVDGLTITSIDCIGGTGTIAVSGNITTTDTTVCQSGTAKILIDGSGAQTIGASGGAGGLPAIEINNSGTVTIQDTIHMDDNWVFTGGTVDAGTSTVVFDGSETSVTTGTMAFNNVTVNFSGANTLSLTDNFDIDGDLTLTDAGDGFGGAGVIEVAGNLTSTWVNCCGSNAITLDGANAQTVDIATGDITSGLFTINKTNPTDIVTLVSAMSLSASSQDLTITQGVLAIGAYDLTVADVLTVDANGDITCTTGTISALSETGAGLPYSCGGNAIPTVASAIPDTTVVEDNAPIDNYRDLKAVFTDTEDGSALTYTIESNTNSGLVTPTIVAADSTLDLSFTASTGGTATITVRATDSGGLWVEDVFTVMTSCPAGSVCWDGGGGGDPNWSNGLNWTGDAVPGYSGLVVFNHLSSNPATFNAVDTIGGFTIEAGYTGTITMAADLLIDHTTGCTFTQNGGTIDLGSVTWEHECPWTHTAGTFTAGTSTVKYRYSHIAMDAGTSVFNNVSIGIASNTDFTVTDTMHVNGNLTITEARNITGTIEVAGNVTTTDLSVTGSGAIVPNGDGAQILSAGGGTGSLPGINIDQQVGGTLAIQDTIKINGYLGAGWTYTAGAVDAGTSTAVFATALTVNSGSMAFNNVILDSTTGMDFTVTGTMDVDGDLTITTIRNVKSGTITVAGNLTSTQTGVGDGSGLIILDGANAQFIDISTGDVPDGLFAINKTNPTDIVTLSSAMNLSGSLQDLTITQGVLAIGAFDLTVADVLTVDANGDITCTTGTVNADSETGAGLPYSCGALAGPIAYWPLDEGGAAQTTADSTSNNNDGTLGTSTGVNPEDPTWVTVGSGYGLEFDGSDDYVEMANEANFDFATGDMSVSAWIYSKAVQPNYAGIVSKYDGSDGAWSFQFDAAEKMVFEWNVTGGDAYDFAETNADIPQNQWLHVVGTLTGSTLRIYVDGAVQTVTDNLSAARATNAQNLRLGQSTLSNQFDGCIDEVRIYDRALGQGEITTLAGSGPSGTCPPTDSSPPDAVANLATGTVTSSSIDLSWTAPGDDAATGTATTYDVRYSTSPITTDNWDSAIQASGEPSPQVAGSSESFTVTGSRNLSTTMGHSTGLIRERCPVW